MFPKDKARLLSQILRQLHITNISTPRFFGACKKGAEMLRKWRVGYIQFVHILAKLSIKSKRGA